jgi:hypothetical protein
MILKLDRWTFPGAFAPNGREERERLVAAAVELERERSVRIVRDERGPNRGVPREVRLGPGEVELAYAAAGRMGYEPIARAIGEVIRHAESLLGAPSWFDSWLSVLTAALRGADPGPLGMSRERFKSEWYLLPDALTAGLALAQGVTPTWERVVSERLFSDSKRLARIRAHVVNILVRADPQWEGVPPEEAFDLLEVYGVRRKPGLLRCAGCAEVQVGGRQYRMEDFSPAAHLPDAWAESWVDAVVAAGTEIVTTVENEYPFLSYVEESGGPPGLGARGEVAVYTAGFPTPALVGALAQLGERGPGIEFRHWGDADIGGLRIWLFLRTRIGRPVKVFRTTRAFVERAADEGARRLSAVERVALRRLMAELEMLSGEDAREAHALALALLETGAKVEQERF